MGFDFAKAIAQAEKDADIKALELIILGQSGGGKSHLIGTLGVKTLYLYFSGESHGVKSAKKNGDHVIPICVDHDDAGQPLSADDAYQRLLACLQDVAGLKANGFEAIAIDGATELEAIIRSTLQWKKMCLTTKGTHSSFEEARSTITMFRPVLNGLKYAQRATGCHIMMTLITDVREYGEHNDVVECAPRLLGYAVAETIIQQFGDVVVVGMMKRNKEIKGKLQFMTDVGKTSKSETGVVKKTINFSPRLLGVDLKDLPPVMDASLPAVLTLKSGVVAKG
jgi:hypothetical protein